MPQSETVWNAKMQVYGAEKVWMQMNREGTRVACCTVERLMGRRGLYDAAWGKKARTAISDANAASPLDYVKRQFKADRPNKPWVSDFAYVSTWQGLLYVAFMIDVYARRIKGWRVSRTNLAAAIVADSLL